MGAVLVFEPLSSPLTGRLRRFMVAPARANRLGSETQLNRHRRRRALRQCLAAGADRRPLRAGKPGACARNGGGAQGDRRPRRRRPRLQDLVRQGQPHLGQERARHRARRGAADFCRNPRHAEAAGAHRRARRRAMRARGAGGRCAADPRVPVPADRSADRRRQNGRSRSTSRRASSWRPGTCRTWSRKSPAPATTTCW